MRWKLLSLSQSLQGLRLIPRRWLQRGLLSLGVILVVALYHPLAWTQVPLPGTVPVNPTIASPGALVSPMAVQQVTMVGMTVGEMESAIAFYSQVLDFHKLSDIEVSGVAYEQLTGVRGARMRVVRMQLGREVIELTDYLAPEGRPIPLDSRSHDHWFQHIAIVVSDMDAAYQRLRAAQVQFVSNMPQTLPDYLTAAAGIKAFYFQDPEGHNLEVIYFPPGKGDPRWQEPTDHLFLGIDHTAIATDDTDTSLKFYRDVLGLRVAGESENYGSEQEHLNNVFGAHLQITGLRAAVGPGIEFLDYLAPPGGRPIPPDLQANDLMQWQTTLVVEAVDQAVQRLQTLGYTRISSQVVSLPDTRLGFQQGCLVRDPDGHVLRLVEAAIAVPTPNAPPQA